MTAVLLLGFNRPLEARQLASTVRQFHGARFYVSVDGAREDVPGEAELVSQTLSEFREGLKGRQVEFRASPENLGCGRAVSSAIDWFFSSESEGVILEDDCIPTPEFWDFSRRMLQEFRHDARVATISGVGYAPAELVGNRVAYFSRYPLLWGWASWRRVWSGYTLAQPWLKREMKASPRWAELGRVERLDWARMFMGASKPPHHTWDYQLVRHAWRRGQWSITPGTTLVRNIGHATGTHSSGKAPHWYRDPDTDSLIAWRKAFAEDPLAGVIPLPDADKWWSRKVISPSLWRRACRKIYAAMT